jgi:hypothetical protein
MEWNYHRLVVGCVVWVASYESLSLFRSVTCFTALFSCSSKVSFVRSVSLVYAFHVVHFSLDCQMVVVKAQDL